MREVCVEPKGPILSSSLEPAADRPRAGVAVLLVTQFQILAALMIREMVTRYGRSAGGYIWALIEPAGHIALLYLVFSQVARHPALGTSFILFFATGYLAFHIYMDISRSVSVAVQVNRPLLNFPRISMLDVVIARFLLQVMTSIVVFVIIIYLIIWHVDPPISIDLLYIFKALSYSALLGLGIGTLNCVLFSFMPTWQRTFNLINRPMFLISGVFFIYEQLPAPAQAVLWWNPLIHITATMRRGFYAEYTATFVSPIYVMALALGGLLLGILLLRLLRARMLEGD